MYNCNLFKLCLLHVKRKKYYKYEWEDMESGQIQEKVTKRGESKKDPKDLKFIVGFELSEEIKKGQSVSS